MMKHKPLTIEVKPTADALVDESGTSSLLKETTNWIHIINADLRHGVRLSAGEVI